MSRFRRRREERAAYTRTSGDMLINDLGPSGTPWVSWVGVDSGGLTSPIGPNGPFAGGAADALPIVTRATSLIVHPITAGPFKVVDAASPGRVLPLPRWGSDPMLARPDDRFGPGDATAVKRLTRSAFWSEWLRSAVWYGVGAFITAEDAQGKPVAGTMRLLHPLHLDTFRDTDRVLRWRLGDEGSGVEFDRDGRLTLGSITYRIVVLRNPHSPIDEEGRSRGVFELAPGAFKLGHQIDTYASGTFRSGIPAGYLKVSAPHLSQTAADELKTAWLAAHGGDRRSIAVLNATTEFTPLTMSPVDAALGEVKKLNVADVAMAFGLDPMTLGATAGSGTYTNLRDAWSNHRDFGLAPWIAAVEDVLTALLPGTQAVKVDLDRFANPTPAERYAAYEVALRLGVLTLDEVREREGLPPLAAPPAVPPVPEEDPADLPPAARLLHIASQEEAAHA